MFQYFKGAALSCLCYERILDACLQNPNEFA